VAELNKGRRITGAEREALTEEVKALYEQGASIRTLAEKTGRSYGFIHRLLTESDVGLRGRGGSVKRKIAD
jgi:predicted transcriptional regulator